VAGVRRPPPVARVLERVTATAREHDMFHPADLVLVSVSGGPDSVCLLYSLWHLRRMFKIKLAVFHFDHSLRDDSGRDAIYVRALARRLGVPFHARTAHSAPRRGESPEAWATSARDFAASVTLGSIGGDVLAEGHTLNDQAETVLLNLIRGTGLEGMSGIAPAHGGEVRVVQPLIGVERSEVEALCRALHLRPRLDPSNSDLRLLRNALRLRGIPALERSTGRGIMASMARTAELLRADRDELERQAAEAYARILVDASTSARVTLDAAQIRAGPPPVASRAIRWSLSLAFSDEIVAPWSREATEAVLDLARGRPGRKRDLAGGLKAWRDREYVHIARSSPEQRPTDEGGSA
jgi:tRNA(Ile)-lysidine synthase